MAGAASVTARTTAGVRRSEWHCDTEDDARKHSGEELALAELEHNAHLPLAFCAQVTAWARSAEQDSGDPTPAALRIQAWPRSLRREALDLPC